MAPQQKPTSNDGATASGKSRPILFNDEMVRAILSGGKSQTRRIVVPMRGEQSTWLTQEMISASPKLKLCHTNPDLIFGAQMEHPKGGPLGFVRFPYGTVGDRLWVREKFSTHVRIEDPHYLPPSYPDAAMGAWYWADGNPDHGDWNTPKPSIHMPRWASRITLEITGVRVERVQEISEEDARAEGVSTDFDYPVEGLACPKCDGHGMHGCFGANYGVSETECRKCDTAKKRFAILWDSICTTGHAARDCLWESNPWVWVIEFRRAA